jgi:hypothetical protein
MTKPNAPKWLGVVTGSRWLKIGTGMTVPPLPKAHFPTRTPGTMFVAVLRGDKFTVMHWERGTRWFTVLDDDGRKWLPWRCSR